MKLQHRLLSFLMSAVLMFSNMGITVNAMEDAGTDVSGNEAFSTYTAIMVNPLYQDVISVEQLREKLAEIRETEEFSPADIAAETTFETVDEAANYMRQQMVLREATISFYIAESAVDSETEFYWDVLDKAMEHTETCSGQEGDALRWGYAGCGVSYGQLGDGYMISYSMSYHTTAEQENELTAKVGEIMAALNLEGKGEYDKVKAIHDYICDNVNYDYDLVKRSAYEALCNGTTVCQGYAIAFYRLCKEAGLSVRIITGIGNSGYHAWNIVKIGDVYYNIDCTWDGQDEETYNTWFLLDDIDFTDHTRDSEFQTVEFYNKYPMADISYGAEIVLLNKDNMSKTFKTIDEETISSAANGKPKILIFFKADCTNSRGTIKSVADYGLTGVDIYALESYQMSKETVREFKETYGNDSIIFSYATDRTNSSAMWAYVQDALGSVGSVTFPVVCYIDANNKFQQLTTARCSGQQIAAYLKRYCGYEVQFEEYTITYELDGGTNHPDNPATYNKHTSDIFLQDPTKEGYTFKGWYSDANYTQPVTRIVSGTTGNITLYALFARELDLQIPTKTTYVVGEELDLSGGTVTHFETGETAALDSTMISGFSTEEEGICTLEVTFKECSLTFDILVVAAPELNAYHGQKLSELMIPVNEYGIYSWEDGAIELDETGEWQYLVKYTPNDTKFGVREDIQVKISVYRKITDDTLVTLEKEEYVYDGCQKEPLVTVSFGEEVVLEEDYVVAYENNLNAGTATVTVTGQNFYEGSKQVTFTIQPAKLTIKAKDMTVLVGDALPKAGEYEIEGLVSGEKLVKEPEFSYTVSNSSVTGFYEIIPANAVATSNYDENITYINGRLFISEERVGYTVSFDVQGYGEAPMDYIGVKAGNTIKEPEKPVAEGYTFAGWYKDAACTKNWDFETDTVQSDVILYAKWSKNKGDSDFGVRVIPDMYYTGKAVKPVVEVYDGDILLKLNKDYKITYKNNVNVNTVLAGEKFNQNLPHVIITGKGSYEDSVSVNFNILPAVIGDGSEEPADGVKLSYSDQLVVNNKKDVSAFKSIKLGKNLKKGVDYEVSLSAIDAVNAQGNAMRGVVSDGVVPAGSKGVFLLTITGKTNYVGSINKTVVVKDKEYLIKNATISIGKNIKQVDYEYYNEKLGRALPAGYYDDATKKYYKVTNGNVSYDNEVNPQDIFTVRSGNKYLICGKDFTADYMDDHKCGTAMMIIKGIGEYSGTKTITFKITGKVFSAKTISVEGIKDQEYNGKPQLQNNVKLTYTDGKVLTYGEDYTIKYEKHINKGKATMVFSAKGESGYQGSFKKTFNIIPASIKKVSQDESMKGISVEFDKAGVKPADKVILRNAAGVQLKSGRDYSISYKNNKSVARYSDPEAPTIIIIGKGNYNDTLEIPFTITKADLNGEKISVMPKEIAYNDKKADDYIYKPGVKILDGKKQLSVNKDFVITYEKNTQLDYKAYYIDKSVSGESNMPKAIITTPEGSNYKLEQPIVIPLPVYQNKLTNKIVQIEVEEAVYTGKQVKPAVKVYYLGDGSKRILLSEDADYTLEYGKNIAAGKNKGTVKIKGISPLYGGSVNVKFTISNKKIIW